MPAIEQIIYSAGWVVLELTGTLPLPLVIKRRSAEAELQALNLNWEQAAQLAED